MSTETPDEQLCVDSPIARSPNQETTTSSSSLVAEPPCALIPSSSRNSLQLFNSLTLPKHVDKNTIQELLIQFHGLLNDTGLGNVADLLKIELESKGLIPPRYAFDGRPRQQTFDGFQSQFRPFGTDLLQILTRLNDQINVNIPPSISNLNIRLFAGPRNSLIRRHINQKRIFTVNSRVARPNIKSLETCRNTSVLMARELGMQIPPRLLQRKQASTEITGHGRFQGHILPVFCVTFDQTGRYVLTGGDDKIIKVWDTYFGRLRYTFRGHTAEVTDLAINSENTCLASGSNDKTVRVWATGNGRPLMVYKKHTALVNMVKFADFIDGDIRYLVSTGNDCMVVFYRYNISTLTFDCEPIRFEEREAPGARGLVLNCSFGGNFVVMGDSTNHIHIYKLSATTVDRIAEFKAHDDRVDSLVWANSHLRFATGSKDGVAKVWEFSSGEWAAKELRIQEQPQLRADANRSSQQARKSNAYVLTMLGWSGDDTRLITAGSDKLIRVWDWKSGELLRKLEGHSYDVFVIRTHPVHNNLIFTAGHDGLLVMWDISTGQALWQHKNQMDMHVSTDAIFDLAIAPQGDRFAYVDIKGTLAIMGVGENRVAKTSQEQQFFSNDYDELFFDENGFVQDIDEIPAHLALPALLVNVDSHPYGPHIQRHVPGRDFTNPNITQNPWSQRSIMPPVSIKEHVLNQKERSHLELKEYEVGKPLDEAELQRRRELAKERQKQAYQAKLEKQRNRKRNQQEQNEQIRDMMRPRYIIDENFTDSDSTYSEGSAHASAEELNETDSEPEINDDLDSDYEEGGVEQPTVFRNRSTVTVTGRRKKNVRVRRNTQNDSQQPPLEDQPSTSQQPVPQHTTRYGRQTKPLNRLENEYEEKNRTVRRPVVAQTPSEPPIRRNTRSRRAQLASDSPLSQEDTLPEYDAQPIRTRQKERQRSERRISSRSDSLVSLHSTESDKLEELDEKIEQEASLDSEESSEENDSFSDEEEEEEARPRKARNTRSSPKRRLPKRNQISSSRSPVSNASDADFKIKQEEDGDELVTTRTTSHIILRSGRESKPPKTLIEEESQRSGRRGHRPSKQLSPQRRSARQAKHHYSFRDDSNSPPPYQNGTARHSRRQASGPRYIESDEDEREPSPVAGPSHAVDRPTKKHSQSVVYPEWMMTSERRRFPYVAQIGDTVVYFVQGHIHYIQLSNISVSHQMDKEMSLFKPEEYFVVMDIEYKLRNGTIVQYVTLAHLQSNGKPDDKITKFCFSDFKDCPDFLFLKQHYDKSRSYEFKQGDSVEMVLSDFVYTGTVKSHQCIDPAYPSSEWNAMSVEWNDGADRCCIWDLQPAKPNRSAQDPVTPEDIDELGKYEPQSGDWPTESPDETLTTARNRFLDRCQKAINDLNEIPELRVFYDMVDLTVYPTYSADVKRPMYLQLISDRIRGLYYRSLLSLKFDIQLIAKNARRFNQQHSQIVTDADLLVATLFQMLDDPTIESAFYLFQQLSESDPPLHYNEKLTPDLSRLHFNENNSTGSVSTNGGDSWQSQCQTMMNQLINTHLANQPAALREHLNELCADMQQGDFQSPDDFKQTLKGALLSEGRDLGKKERRYIELTRLMNDLDKQFDAILSQYQRAQNARRTRFRPTTTDNSQAYATRQVEKRVLRSQTHHPDEPSTSRSKRTRYY